MQWKSSPRTRKLMSRQGWMFWPLWLGTAGYSYARGAEWIDKSWDSVFFLFFEIGFSVALVVSIMGLQSARNDLSKSQHPDSDVAALIDEEITITEYRQRKEVRDESI